MEDNNDLTVKTIDQEESGNLTPQRRTAQQKKAMIEALSECLGIVTRACEMTGVKRRTFYNWMENDPEFKSQVEELENIALDFVEDKLLGRIRNGDTVACIFYLKTKGKKRGYVEKSEIDITDRKINIQEIHQSDKD